MRLIDANALMQAFRAYMVDRYDSEKCILEENCKACDRPCLWWRKVNEAPTVDAVEVVYGYDTGRCRIFHCSICGYGVNDIFQEDEHNYPVGEFNYCPNCGADMGKSKED